MKKEDIKFYFKLIGSAIIVVIATACLFKLNYEYKR